MIAEMSLIEQRARELRGKTLRVLAKITKKTIRNKYLTFKNKILNLFE